MQSETMEVSSNNLEVVNVSIVHACSHSSCGALPGSSATPSEQRWQWLCTRAADLTDSADHVEACMDSADAVILYASFDGHAEERICTLVDYES
jgi:hypothetical protein